MNNPIARRHMTELVDQAVLMHDMLGAERALKFCEDMGIPTNIVDRIFKNPEKRRRLNKSVSEICEDLNIPGE